MGPTLFSFDFAANEPLKAYVDFCEESCNLKKREFLEFFHTLLAIDNRPVVSSSEDRNRDSTTIFEISAAYCCVIISISVEDHFFFPVFGLAPEFSTFSEYGLLFSRQD